MDVWKESLDMDNHAVLALYEGPYSIGLSNPAFRRYFSMHPAIPPQWTVSFRSCRVKRRLLYFTALFKLMDKLKPLHDYGERQRLAYGIFGRLKKKPVVPRCVYSLYKWGTKTPPTGEVTEKLSNSSADRTTIEVKDTTNFMNFTDWKQGFWKKWYSFQCTVRAYTQIFHKLRAYKHSIHSVQDFIHFWHPPPLPPSPPPPHFKTFTREST